MWCTAMRNQDALEYSIENRDVHALDICKRHDEIFIVGGLLLYILIQYLTVRTQ